jgi:hypothetical protein
VYRVRRRKVIARYAAVRFIAVIKATVPTGWRHVLKKDPPRPSINEEAARILRAAASVAEERIRKRFPEKRRV